MKIEKALLNPQTYPFQTKKIDLIQTHISWVFLTEKYAFKVKKPVNFGFLDFSTIEKRKYYCQRELKLNQRLCPEIYLKVLPITKSDRIIVGGKGKIIDWALMMKKFPQEKILSESLKKKNLSQSSLKKLAEILSSFHKKAKTNNKYGKIKTIKFNWRESFEQTKSYQEKTISKRYFDLIKKRIEIFIAKNEKLFQKRIAQNKIKWCHGDLHSGNILIDKDKIHVFDCIEFNKRFAIQDTASDIAFLIMDLEFHEKKEEANLFLKYYLRESKDKGMLKLLGFYKCYRAFVRGKISSFQDKREDAKKYFNLAFNYSQNLDS